MSPPPLLLGAALLFWGWQTGFLLVALPLAVLIEAARALTWRLELSSTDFHRVRSSARNRYRTAATWSCDPSPG